MPAGGEITIALGNCGTASAFARISSTRPVDFCKQFAGRTPDEVVRLAPLIFSICGMAQGVAAVSAAEQAMGAIASEPTRISRQLLVAGESAREHLIRVLVQWPQILGEARHDALLARVMSDWKRLRAATYPGRALAILGEARPESAATGSAIRAFERTIQTAVLGEPAAVFTQRSAGDLASWCGSGATPAQRLVRHVLSRRLESGSLAQTAFLPAGVPPQVAHNLFGDNAGKFAAQPLLDGQTCETSAFARQAASPLVGSLAERHGSALLARIVAVIHEITLLPGLMRAAIGGHQPAAAIPCGPGRAIGFVEAARGRLMHAVEIAGGRIARYAILAPTEWNFHPQGVAAVGLAAIAAAGRDVPELARLFISALDPCVAFELRIA